MDYHSIIREQHEELMVMARSVEKGFPVIVQMAEMMVGALKSGRKLLSAGNGGSATDAMHIAEELTGRYRANRIALPAIALCSDGAALTCISNDFGYEQVFSRQVEALGRPGDILVVFSTSGNSPNLILALETAKKKEVTTIALLGRDGGKTKGLADLEWIVPSESSARVQEIHTWVLHVLLEVVEREFPASH